MDITKLSAARLESELAKRFAASSEATKDLVAAGFGEVKINDLRAMPNKPSCIVAFFKAHDSEMEAYAEERARRIYSGSLKPIKRSA